MTVTDFLSAVDAIQAEKPAYRLGGKASDGTCDCIGLVIGALSRCGVKWPGIHGSNWAARGAMACLLPAASAGELQEGEVVYKVKEPGAAGYALPGRYAASPDQRDYYHVGVVRSVRPLRIVHCTSPGGMTVDSKLGKWAYHGKLAMLAAADDASDQGRAAKSPEATVNLPSPLAAPAGAEPLQCGDFASAEATGGLSDRPPDPFGVQALNIDFIGNSATAPKSQKGEAAKSPEATVNLPSPLAASAEAEPLPQAEVTSPDGNPVKLRAKPSRQCGLYWLVPSGASVEVLSEDSAWWRVRYGTRTGYMMAEFLSRG